MPRMRVPELLVEWKVMIRDTFPRLKES